MDPLLLLLVLRHFLGPYDARELLDLVYMRRLFIIQVLIECCNGMLLIRQVVCGRRGLIRLVRDALLWQEVFVGLVVPAGVHPESICLLCYRPARVDHALFQKLAGRRETVSGGLLRLYYLLGCLFPAGSSSLAKVPLARSELVTWLSSRAFHFGDVRLEATRVSNLERGAGIGSGLGRTTHLDVPIIEGAQHDG